MLTSTTVIPDDATDIKVYLTDDRILSATLADSDAASEGALVRIEPTAGASAGDSTFTAIALADSDQVRVGDPVYTCGNPQSTIQQHGRASLSLGRIFWITDYRQRERAKPLPGLGA